MVVLTTKYSDRFVDARQLRSPMILTILSKAIQQIEPGQILALCASDPEAKREVSAWCKQSGNRLLETMEQQQLVTFYIRRRP